MRRKPPEAGTAPGRIRQYLPQDQGRDWDTSSSLTPEGRLSGANDSDWYVPDGSEKHLRLKSRGKGKGYQGSYRTSDFKVDSTDAKGHSAPDQIRTQVTPQMMNEIDSIINSKRFPISSRRHFALTGMFELLVVLRRLEPVPNHLAILEQLNAINKNNTVSLQYEETVDLSRDTIRTHLRKGHVNAARVMVHEVLSTIKKIPSREIREELDREVRKEFREVMRGAGVRVSGRGGAAVSKLVDEQE